MNNNDLVFGSAQVAVSKAIKETVQKHECACEFCWLLRTDLLLTEELLRFRKFRESNYLMQEGIVRLLYSLDQSLKTVPFETRLLRHLQEPECETFLGGSFLAGFPGCNANFHAFSVANENCEEALSLRKDPYGR